MLAVSVGFQKWGRDARPEMMLCLWMTVAMGCFHRGLEAKGWREHVLWMAAFWIAMGLANLAKEFVPLLLSWPLLAYVMWRGSAQSAGDDRALRLMRMFLIVVGAGLALHLAMTAIPSLRWWTYVGVPGAKGYYGTMAVCLGAPMLAYAFETRPWRAIGRLLPTAVPGAAVMAAMFVPWMLYMRRLFPGFAEGVFSEQVTDRASGTGPWTVNPDVLLYFQSLLTLTLPWVAFVPGACAVALMRRFREHRGGLAYLLLWSVGLVLLFTASAAKREHYILPMLPAFCLLMGYAAEDALFNHRWISERLMRLLGAGHGLAAVGGVIAVAVLAAVGKTFPNREQGWATAGIALAAAVPMAAGGVLAWRGRLRVLIGLLATTMLVFYVGYWGTLPRWDERRPIRDFAVEVSQRVPPGDELYHWGDAQAKMAYYVGRVLPSLQWMVERENPPRAGEDSGAWTARMQEASLDWLAEHPARGRWLIDYAAHRAPLEALGYEERLHVKDAQERKLVFVLYERGAKTQALTQSSASPASTSSPVGR
jgi:4-amino-4-deoxy-L-arabinose transferase-like glycosyltransferase